MPPKRKRREANGNGLAAGQTIDRSALQGNNKSNWWWAGTEVFDAASITNEYYLAACGLSSRNRRSICANKYVEDTKSTRRNTPPKKDSGMDIGDDVIVVSEDSGPTCTKKSCKTSPFCLNYLGQDKWENEADARERFYNEAKLGENPLLDAKDSELPVGLRNLGATCYANASLQVWFRDTKFRRGVYSCEPSNGSSEEKYKESPIFQLQVSFAALQEGTQSVFNPVKLVESLQLRTTEQQDAQEFSKLFMSHLDAEFKKQANPATQSLITDQFEGKQVYGTVCDKCGYKSERESNFLEIEVNLQQNSTLENCLSNSLQQEKLTGDNKYHCSKCDSLQDATRYTELRALPPVLHFSLLRFVYDLNTMERKKSKHYVSFPPTLDMGKFLGNANVEGAPTDVHDEYVLRGILLHKGASAYYGHYEAQVYDPGNQTWYQFNDEEVTKIEKLGDKQPSNKVIVIDDADVETGSKEKPAAKKQRTNNARKKRRIEDSDIEETPKEPIKTSTTPTPNSISSKDAYMLVYARKEATQADTIVETEQDLASQLVPPARALEVVQMTNAAHDEACEKFEKREQEAKAAFEDRRKKVMAIYRRWVVDSNPEANFAVVSQKALENWLSKTCMESSARPFRGGSPLPEEETKAIPLPMEEDILCTHQKLDYQKAANMKCITLEAYDMIKAETGCSLLPRLTTNDVCRICVDSAFAEKLYQIEHPRNVLLFDSLCNPVEGSPSYWISKLWLKDWRLVKPKMHTPNQDDPSPGEAEWDSHVRCEHGNLCRPTTNRKRISEAGHGVLASLFPFWVALSGDDESCAVCEAQVMMTKGDRQETRKRAEEEKQTLKYMFDFALTGNMLLLENVPCVIVPSSFVRDWRQWVQRPTERPRPEGPDTSPLFCTEHQLLNFDPNSVDLDESLAIIRRVEYDKLSPIYSMGPAIPLEKMSLNGTYRYEHDIPVCHECRETRKTDWESAEITIRRGKGSPSKEESKAVSTSNGARQSKRLRGTKKTGERRKILITKVMTVKDIKVLVNAEFSIPTIYQRLYHNDKELVDNAVTVESLKIFSGDTIDLQEEDEGSFSDSDDDGPRKKQRNEGTGFGGTLLGHSSLPASSEGEPDPPSTEDEATKKCRQCTLHNSLDADVCEACEGTDFDQ